jgi:hypothetical protein
MIQERNEWGVLFAADKLALRCPPEMLLRAGDVAYAAVNRDSAQLYYLRAIQLTADRDQRENSRDKSASDDSRTPTLGAFPKTSKSCWTRSDRDRATRCIILDT